MFKQVTKTNLPVQTFTRIPDWADIVMEQVAAVAVSSV